MWQFFSTLIYVLAACFIGHISILCSKEVLSCWNHEDRPSRSFSIRSLHILSFPNLVSAWLTGIFQVTYMYYRDIPKGRIMLATWAGPFAVLALTAVHIVLYKYLFTHIPFISLLSEAGIRAGIMWSMIAFLPLPGLPLLQTLCLAYSPQLYYQQHTLRHVTPFLAIAIFIINLFIPIPPLDWTSFLSDAIFTAIYIMS